MPNSTNFQIKEMIDFCFYGTSFQYFLGTRVIPKLMSETHVLKSVNMLDGTKQPKIVILCFQIRKYDYQHFGAIKLFGSRCVSKSCILATLHK